MHNLRPGSKIWPEKAFKTARKAQNLIYLAYLFHINILLCFTYKHISFGPRTCKKTKILGPQRKFSCAPCYIQIFQKITVVYTGTSYHSNVTICDSGVRWAGFSVYISKFLFFLEKIHFYLIWWDVSSQKFFVFTDRERYSEFHGFRPVLTSWFRNHFRSELHFLRHLFVRYSSKNKLLYTKNNTLGLIDGTNTNIILL